MGERDRRQNDWCDRCDAPQWVLPDGEHACASYASLRTQLAQVEQERDHHKHHQARNAEIATKRLDEMLRLRPLLAQAEQRNQELEHEIWHMEQVWLPEKLAQAEQREVTLSEQNRNWIQENTRLEHAERALAEREQEHIDQICAIGAKEIIPLRALLAQAEQELISRRRLGLIDRDRIAQAEQEREFLQRVIDDKYPAPPNFYLRRLQTDLAEAEQRVRALEPQIRAAVENAVQLILVDPPGTSFQADADDWAAKSMDVGAFVETITRHVMAALTPPPT
jgi:hypothetical protein